MRSRLIVLLPLLCLGARSSLKGKPVRELRVVAPAAACPGVPQPFAVMAVLEDGSELGSVGLGDGRIAWRNYDVRMEGGTLPEAGVFTLDADARVTWGGAARLDVVATTANGIAWWGPIAPRYDCAFAAELGGVLGADGANGQRGGDGIAGHPGERGHDGRSGRDGGPGPVLNVRVARIDAPSGPLLQVEVRSLVDDRVAHVAVQPGAGTLRISATGGPGGHGGRGGDGGAGGSGNETSRPGSGGDGADGGNGGHGGAGGQIVVHVDPAAEALLGAVTFDTSGGSGGVPGSAGRGGTGGGSQGREGFRGESGADGPPARIIVEAVPALW